MQQPKFLKKKETTTSATTAKKKQKKGKTYIPGGFSTSAVPDNIEKYYKLSWKWNRVKTDITLIQNILILLINDSSITMVINQF